MRATQSVRATVLRPIPLFALLASGCLMEYVLPGDPATDTGATTPASPDSDTDSDTGPGPESEGDASGNTGVTGDAPTSGETGDTPQPCAEGQLRCGEGCIDPGTDEAHCGSCGDPCKSDELCIVGECRDVLVLECEGCPCPDQCPQADGVLASTTGDGDGDSPDKHLCCVVEAPDQAPQVLCVIGDPEDALVCPQA